MRDSLSCSPWARPSPRPLHRPCPCPTLCLRCPASPWSRQRALACRRQQAWGRRAASRHHPPFWLRRGKWMSSPSARLSGRSRRSRWIYICVALRAACLQSRVARPPSFLPALPLCATGATKMKWVDDRAEAAATHAPASCPRQSSRRRSCAGSMMCRPAAAPCCHATPPVQRHAPRRTGNGEKDAPVTRAAALSSAATRARAGQRGPQWGFGRVAGRFRPDT